MRNNFWPETFTLSLVAKNNVINMVGAIEELDIKNISKTDSIISFKAYPTDTKINIPKGKLINLFILWTTDEKNYSAISKTRQTRGGIINGKKIREEIYNFLIFGRGEIIKFKYLYNHGALIIELDFKLKIKEREMVTTGNINKFVEKKLKGRRK